MIKEVTDFKLPKEYKVKENKSLLSQAMFVYGERSHVGLRQAKTRAEVLRTGKKLYKQKGTGGARHGSKRAPIFAGGGVALGPRAIRRVLTLPSKLKALSKKLALSAKSEAKDIVFVTGLDKIAKTGEVASFLKKLKKRRYTFIFADKDRNKLKVVKNLKEAKSYVFGDINVRQIILGGTLVVDVAVFKTK